MLAGRRLHIDPLVRLNDQCHLISYTLLNANHDIDVLPTLYVYIISMAGQSRSATAVAAAYLMQDQHL